MDVDVARAAFIRLRDVRSVELVNQVAAGLVAGTPHNLLRANVAAWQGDFDQAAKLYVSEGQLEKVRVACCRMGAGMASTKRCYRQHTAQHIASEAVVS